MGEAGELPVDDGAKDDGGSQDAEGEGHLRVRNHNRLRLQAARLLQLFVTRGHAWSLSTPQLIVHELHADVEYA